MHVDELAAGGIELHPALFDAVAGQPNEVAEVEQGHMEFRQQLITHFVQARARGLVQWMRS